MKKMIIANTLTLLSIWITTLPVFFIVFLMSGKDLLTLPGA